MKQLIPWMHKLALFIIIIYTGILFINLGRDYLFDWDEGIYATLGAEMTQSGNLLIPTWNHELWLEKPPMIAWVAASGIKIFGQTEFGARFFMPIFAGLTLYAVFRLGEKIGGTLMGAASMAILGYFNLFLSRARTLNTDGMLLTAIAWVSWLLLAGSPAWIVGLVMGLSIMAKGASGLLAILIALPLLIKKSKPYLLSTFSFLLLTILPWHLYTYLVHGQAFIQPYLLEQVIRRATIPIEFHLESRWYYFNFLLKDLGIGIVTVALIGYLLIFKNLLKGVFSRPHLLILTWILIPLIIFTLAKTRLSWYILPVYPGIALAIGYVYSSFDQAKRLRPLLSLLVVGMLIQMLVHGYQYLDPERQPSPLPPILQVATALKVYPGEYIAVLVSENERVAEAILPASQKISSSFRYGGAPSVVWYSQKKILYFYNYDHFMAESSNNPAIASLILTHNDLSKVPPGFTKVLTSGSYYGFTREKLYADR